MDSGIGRRIYRAVYDWVQRCPDPSDPRGVCPPDPLHASAGNVGATLPATATGIAAGTAAGVVFTVYAAASMLQQPSGRGEQ
jgi:hypothetical protein